MGEGLRQEEAEWLADTINAHMSEYRWVRGLPRFTLICP